MTTDFIQIAFDSKTFDRQKSYNLEYAKAVNEVLNQLRNEIEGLADSDIIDFLSHPQSLIDRLESKDFEEYRTYIESIPPSVGNSMKFKCEKGDIINRLHKLLPSPTSYFHKVNTCKIKDGECFFDETLLREKCTISGSPETLKAWETANEVADALNRLNQALKKLHPDMHAVESVVSLDMGLIRSTKEGYFADIDRLRQLI